jgi:cysteinyl-tRNA synthetase
MKNANSPPEKTNPPVRPGVLSLIGNTPLVPIRTLCPNPNVEIYAKLERNNPGGSVKDRIALYMIEEAERTGELTKDKIILEATSGNTGIGLAMVASIKGYRIVLAMSEGVSIERRKILTAYGAEFLLTPADRGTDGAIELVYGLAAEKGNPYFLADQYNNSANILAHYNTTALEIWEQTRGRITHFVATMGTTGTVMGCSKRFKELNPSISVVGVEPYLGHKIQGLKNLKEAYVPGIYRSNYLDEKANIEDDAAFEMARRLAREEGLLVGMSSGAAMHIACEKAKQIDKGVIVAILPDGGERYLSTTLFQVKEPEAVPTKLHFFNTLSKRYEPFEPLSGGTDVTMYSCGPTVHQRPHLGLLRRMLVDDLVRRTLEFSGYRVKHVVSITDIDDLVIQESERLGQPIHELCTRHETEFYEDLKALNIEQATDYVRSSASVEDMIRLTRSLIDKGYAYENLNSVYFNIGRLESYGELSGKDLGKIKIGATVDLDRYDKNDPRDFTLFRRSTLAEMRKGFSFKTTWGNVRPSWHIECSAMARAHLGDRFDIHMGSVDLIFPHNENELAQSRALTGETQARFWLHSELVLVGGKKMTYAEESRVTLPDLLERGYLARDIRFFLIQAHYRQPVRITDERLEASRASLRRLDAFVTSLSNISSSGPRVAELEDWLAVMKGEFTKALFDDVNVPSALASLFRLTRQVNHLISKGQIHNDDAQTVLSALAAVDRVLSIFTVQEIPYPVPDEIYDLVRERDEARKTRDFQKADDIRHEITCRGYLVHDLPEGTRVSRRP